MLAAAATRQREEGERGGDDLPERTLLNASCLSSGCVLRSAMQQIGICLAVLAGFFFKTLERV